MMVGCVARNPSSENYLVNILIESNKSQRLIGRINKQDRRKKILNHGKGEGSEFLWIKSKLNLSKKYKIIV